MLKGMFIMVESSTGVSYCPAFCCILYNETNKAIDTNAALRGIYFNENNQVKLPKIEFW